VNDQFAKRNRRLNLK